jgi:hypothetical protein
VRIFFEAGLGAEHPVVEGAAGIGFGIELELAGAVFFRNDMHGAAVDGEHPNSVPIDQQQFFACESRHWADRLERCANFASRKGTDVNNFRGRGIR